MGCFWTANISIASRRRSLSRCSLLESTDPTDPTHKSETKFSGLLSSSLLVSSPQFSFLKLIFIRLCTGCTRKTNIYVCVSLCSVLCVCLQRLLLLFLRAYLCLPVSVFPKCSPSLPFFSLFMMFVACNHFLLQGFKLLLFHSNPIQSLVKSPYSKSYQLHTYKYT